MDAGSKLVRWMPQTETVLDLRLAHFCDKDYENDLISEKAKEMNVRMETLYSMCSYISLKGYTVLIENCPNLKQLYLHGAYKTGDAALKALSNLPNLEVLDVNFARNALYVENMGQMCRFDPDHVEWITDIGIGQILANCKKLHTLDISGTRVTKLTLEAIAKCESIRTLKIHSCWNLTKQDITTLVLSRPDMIISTENDMTYVNDEYSLVESQTSRCFVKTPSTSGGFTISLNSNVSENERRLISPRVFVSMVS